MNYRTKRFLFAASAAVTLASCATAQEATEVAAAPTSAPLQAFYSFETNEAAAVVGALDAMVAECGDKIPAQISLYSEIFNGTDPATHTVGFAYEDAAAIAKTGDAFTTCPGAAAFYSTINEVIEPVSNTLAEGVVGGGDPGADQAFMVFQMGVSDEAAYGGAFAQFMEASATAGILPGSYGLFRMVTASDGITHWAYIGAPDITSLLAANSSMGPNENAARVAFNDAVAGIRKMHNSRITVRVKDFNTD